MIRVRGRAHTVLRSLPALLAGVLLAQPVLLAAASGPAWAQTPDAKTSLAAGEQAARVKDWATAATEFAASNASQPSAQALEGLANARYQLKDLGAAYTAYDQFLTLYGANPKTTPAKKKLATDRRKELAQKTGELTLAVSEAGAAVTIDEQPAGTTPLSALRLSAGPHHVRVAKDGFTPYDQAPDVPPGTTTNVDITLQPASGKAKLTVREKAGRPLRVFVDGVDMGDAPWSGEVEAGSHEVSGRSPVSAAPPERVTLERGKSREVELVAVGTTATLKIATSDGKGSIYLDGKLVGEGTYGSELPSGKHRLRVTREGYDPVEEEFVLADKENRTRTLTLKLSSKVQTAAIQKQGRPLDGLYAGFSILGTVMPGGMKSDIQRGCQASDRPAELRGCDGAGASLGAGLTGFVGYHWDPIGVELFAGGQYDQSTPTLTWGPSSNDPGIGPDPPRTESFSIRRAGGMGAARIRYSLQGEKLRFTVAGGVGLAYRVMHLERNTIGIADPANQRDVFVPEAQSYVAPLVSFEPSIQWRVGASTALALGVAILLEAPGKIGSVPETPPDGRRRLGVSGLTTPRYQLATDTQFYFGPFIGMMFGP